MRVPHIAHGIQETTIIINHTEFVLQGIKWWGDAILHDHWTAIELETRDAIDLLLEVIKSDPFVCRCPVFKQGNAIFVPSLAGDHICGNIIEKRLFGIYQGNYSKTQVWYVEHMSPQLLAELGKPGTKITQGWYRCSNVGGKKQEGGGKQKGSKRPTTSWSKLFAPATNVQAAIARIEAQAKGAKKKSA
jgi:hypothetical protein